MIKESKWSQNKQNWYIMHMNENYCRVWWKPSFQERMLPVFTENLVCEYKAQSEKRKAHMVSLHLKENCSGWYILATSPTTWAPSRSTLTCIYTLYPKRRQAAVWCRALSGLGSTWCWGNAVPHDSNITLQVHRATEEREIFSNPKIQLLKLAKLTYYTQG